MTDDELLALARKATPGPWRQDVMYVTAEIPGGRPGGEVIVEARATVDRHRDRARDVKNAAYIAAANPAAIIAMIERHRAEVERLTRERDEAYKLIYVPGLWECAKCGCNLVVTKMHANTGAMRASNEPQRCPNDCGPMWRKTERKAGNELVDRLDAEITKREAAESALAAERKRVGELEAALKKIVADADSDDGLTAWDGSDIARAALAGKD